MCTSELYNGSRIVHRSIVREISQTHSIESDCVVVDDDDDHRASNDFQYIQSAAIEGSEPDITDTDLYNNTKNASTESLPRRSTFTSSQSSCTQTCYEHFIRPRLRSFSPHSALPTNKQDPLTFTVSSRAQSIETLPLPLLRETTTGDSGTGDSTTIQIEPSFSLSQYEGVPVYGHPNLVFIANRYDFDLTKVAEYKKRTLKSMNPFSRLLNRLTSSSSNEIPCTPAVRHHPSTHTESH